MKIKQQGPTTIQLLSMASVLAFVVGWVLNIVTIAGSNFNELTGMLVLRVIGIFVAPLGAVLGYF